MGIYTLLTMNKPTIGFYNGEISGTGAAMALSSRYRISTDSTAVNISASQDGWIIDGGLSYFLSRLRGGRGKALGRYLACTGAVLSGNDLLISGFSTHHTPSTGDIHGDNNMIRCLEDRVEELKYEEDYCIEGVVETLSLLHWKLDVRNEAYENPYESMFQAYSAGLLEGEEAETNKASYNVQTTTSLGNQFGQIEGDVEAENDPQTLEEMAALERLAEVKKNLESDLDTLEAKNSKRIEEL